MTDISTQRKLEQQLKIDEERNRMIVKIAVDQGRRSRQDRPVHLAQPDGAVEEPLQGGIVAHEGSVMDWQGPYYYIRGVFGWN